MSDKVDLTDLPYVPLVPYNGTGASGGDPLLNNLNLWYEVCRLPSHYPPAPGYTTHLGANLV